MFDWLIDALLYIPRVLFSWITDAILYMVDNFPFHDEIYDLVNNIQNSLDSFPPDALYMLNICQFEYGVHVVVISLTIRFLIKLTPFIG